MDLYELLKILYFITYISLKCKISEYAFWGNKHNIFMLKK